MQSPANPPDEEQRLSRLYSYAVLDTEPEEEFDILTRLAARFFDAPISVISFVDRNRQWFKSKHGLEAPETARDVSFCGHTILSDQVFVVNDASKDPRFSDNPLVTDDPKIRFYAGAPIITTDDHRIGTLCLIDTKTREFTERDAAVLKELTAFIIALLELRLARAQLTADVAKRKGVEADLIATSQRLKQQENALAALTRNPLLRAGDPGVTHRLITEVAAQNLGVSRASIWFYDHDRAVLRCEDLFEMPTCTHSAGNELRATDYPEYFAALGGGRTVAAHDAPADARTREFAEGYLAPLGITSMLDAPVRTDRGVVGVLCCEHTGAPRQWTLDEQNFAGTLADFIALGLEIADRKAAETALRQFKSTLDATRDCVFMFHTDTLLFFYVNRGACDQLGYDEAQLLTLHPYDIEPEHPEPEYRQMIAPLLDGREPSARFETVQRHKDGYDLAVEVFLQLVRPLGEPARFLAIVTDIGARKEQERRLQETLQLLRQSNEQLEEFAYVASHDLQEPLRAVSGFARLLERQLGPKLDESVRELIGHVVEGTGRMQALIHDLLAYSRLSQEDKPHGLISLGDALDEALRNLEIPVRETGSIVFHDELPSVLAERAQMVQLLQNLVGNAIKFCPERRPEIHILAEHQMNFWKIGVKDNGIGISSEYTTRIFKIFQRLHTRDEYAGTGIGLAICHRIVDRHGGRIWVESVPGEGSTFFFTIPDVVSLLPSRRKG